MGTIVEEDLLNNSAGGQKQNVLQILLPGARKLDFPFTTFTVVEASVLASGK